MTIKTIPETGEVSEESPNQTVPGHPTINISPFSATFRGVNTPGRVSPTSSLSPRNTRDFDDDDALSDRIVVHDLPRPQMIHSHGVLVSPITRSKTHAAPTATRATVVGIWSGQDNKQIFNIPKRVFQWIYSISLVLFMILMLGLVAVTPIDVIVQTTGATSGAIKLFIVIIVCVIFLVASIFWYFARLIHVRMLMNDIPSKSVYMPFEGDLPKDAVRMISDNLRRCVGEIKVRAGPLYNEDVILNHPGMSPPEYIQSRNRKRMDMKDFGQDGNIIKVGHQYGTALPPKANYEDILRSIGDKFVNGRSHILSEVVLPVNYSMREIIISLYRLHMDPESFKSPDREEMKPDVKRIVHLYEKFRFGKDLIVEKDFWEFMIEFDKLAQVCQSDYHENLSKYKRATKTTDDHQNLVDESMKGTGYVEGSNRFAYQNYYYGQDEEDEDSNLTGAGSLSDRKASHANDDSSANSVINPSWNKSKDGHLAVSDAWGGRRFKSANSLMSAADTASRHSSARQSIKDRIAVGGDRRMSRASGLSKVHLAFEADTDSIKKRNSGYDTDSEHDNVFGNNDEEDDDDDDDDELMLDIYNFRFGGSYTGGSPMTPDRSEFNPRVQH